MMLQPSLLLLVVLSMHPFLKPYTVPLWKLQGQLTPSSTLRVRLVTVHEQIIIGVAALALLEKKSLKLSN